MQCDPNLSTKEAGAYVCGTGILWGALVEFGIAKVLEAWALGFVGVMLAFSDVQVSLFVGFAEFLSSIVVLWTAGPIAAIRGAWEGPAFQMFGPFAPLVVLTEILVIVYVGLWGVRRL